LSTPKHLEQFEPLISDKRLERIVDALHKEFPVSEDFTFFTYYQPGYTQVLDDGARVNYQERAAFAILLDNPRHKEFRQLFFAYAPLDKWQERDAAKPKGIQDDPAYQVFKVGPIPAAIQWLENMSALIN
jgi:hypothetical protein